MSEYYVEVQFKCPNERVESVKGIIESSIRSSSTEETITSLSTLGDGIRELLEKVDSDGDRLWLDEDSTVGEQFHVEEWSEKNGVFKVEYMCSSYVATEFKKIVRKLFKLAGMDKLKIKGTSEDQL